MRARQYQARVRRPRKCCFEGSTGCCTVAPDGIVDSRKNPSFLQDMLKCFSRTTVSVVTRLVYISCNAIKLNPYRSYTRCVVPPNNDHDYLHWSLPRKSGQPRPKTSLFPFPSLSSPGTHQTVHPAQNTPPKRFILRFVLRLVSLAENAIQRCRD